MLAFSRCCLIQRYRLERGALQTPSTALSTSSTGLDAMPDAGAQRQALSFQASIKGSRHAIVAIDPCVWTGEWCSDLMVVIRYNCFLIHRTVCVCATRYVNRVNK